MNPKPLHKKLDVNPKPLHKKLDVNPKPLQKNWTRHLHSENAEAASRRLNEVL